MITRRHFFTLAAGASAVGLGLQRLFSTQAIAESAESKLAGPALPKITHPDAEWKKLLTPEQYDVLRESGTEMPGSGKLLNVHADGVFLCAGCDLDLFRSQAKFESGTGWPSFYEPIAANHVHLITDASLFMSRTEVRCARCEGHLGHVFDDGPPPTGKRYCMNSVAMKFKAA